MTTISAVVSYKSGTCGDFLTLLLMSGHPDIKLVEIGDHGSLPNSVYFQNKFDHNFYATMLGEGIVGKVNFFAINPRKDDPYFSLKGLENTFEKRKWAPVIISGHFHVWIHRQMGTKWPNTVKNVNTWVHERFKGTQVLFTKTTTEKSIKLLLLNDYYKNMIRVPDLYHNNFRSFNNMISDTGYTDGVKLFSEKEAKMIDDLKSPVIELEDVYNKAKLRNILTKTFSWWDDLYYEDLFNMYIEHQLMIPESKNIL